VQISIEINSYKFDNKGKRFTSLFGTAKTVDMCFYQLKNPNICCIPDEMYLEIFVYIQPGILFEDTLLLVIVIHY
jgi:hypothetical protein